jgi:hypothetical protein
MKPRLENWRIGFGDQIIGQVYNDLRFPDGEVIVTSKVVELDPKTGEVRTKNTHYILGKRADEPSENN